MGFKETIVYGCNHWHFRAHTHDPPARTDFRHILHVNHESIMYLSCIGQLDSDLIPCIGFLKLYVSHTLLGYSRLTLRFISRLCSLPGFVFISNRDRTCYSQTKFKFLLHSPSASEKQLKIATNHCTENNCITKCM